MKHCCDKFAYLVKKGMEIEYFPETRSYSMLLNDSENFCTHTEIYYCSWCGTKLPEDLSDVWARVLREEYGINDPIKHEHEDGSTIGTEPIPEEFNTDEWWKKRGL